MDSQSTLLRIEHDRAVLAIAQEYLKQDSRVTFHQEDGVTFLKQLSQTPQEFDLNYPHEA